MIKKYLIICSLSFSLNVTAQIPETNPNFHATDNWVFGDSVWLKFTPYGIIENSLPLDVFAESSSSYSDKNGNLMFYIQPELFFNSTGKALQILAGGNSSRQGSLVLKSDNDSLFYIFTNEEGESNKPKILTISVYNTYTKKILKSQIIHNNAVEGLSSVNYSNNRDIIIASHDKNSDKFRFFILSNIGLLCCPVTQNVGEDFSKGKYIVWYNGSNFRFSSNGNLFVSSPSDIQNSINERCDIFQFNKEQIHLTSSITIRDAGKNGISFSPNNNYVYLNNNRIFQYNLRIFDSASVANSRTEISPTWNNSLSCSQLGPNGKIYFIHYDSSYLGLINNPNEPGLACNYIEKGLRLNNKSPNYGLPNFNASYFYTPSIDFAYTEDCWGHSYAFEGRDTLQATSWKWLFKDVRNETIEVRQGKNVTYTFPQADSLENKYEVSHIASTATRSDTVTKTLTIRPKWEIDILGKDTFYCAGDKSNIVLQAPPNMHCVHWNGEEPNLDESLGPIVDYDHFHTDTFVIDTAGTYIVKLTNKTFCQMYDTLVVEEKPRPDKPVIRRVDNQLTSSVVASLYRWYYNGKLKVQTQVQTQKPDSNGYYQVQLLSEFGCESALSDSFYVGFASIKSFDNNHLTFSIYPNPSDGKVTIEVPKKGVYHIVVTDMTGKQVFSTSQNLHLTLEFAFELVRGNYIITLTDEEGNVGSKPITINR